MEQAHYLTRLTPSQESAIIRNVRRPLSIAEMHALRAVEEIAVIRELEFIRLDLVESERGVSYLENLHNL